MRPFRRATAVPTVETMPYVFVVIENDRSRRSVAASSDRHRAGVGTRTGERSGPGVLVGGAAFETEDVPAMTIRPADHLVPLTTRARTTGAPQGSAEPLQVAARRDGALWDRCDAAEAGGGRAAGERA
jgi:hypothetical protein